MRLSSDVPAEPAPTGDDDLPFRFPLTVRVFLTLAYWLTMPCWGPEARSLRHTWRWVCWASRPRTLGELEECD